MEIRVNHTIPYITQLLCWYDHSWVTTLKITHLLGLLYSVKQPNCFIKTDLAQRKRERERQKERGRKTTYMKLKSCIWIKHATSLLHHYLTVKIRYPLRKHMKYSLIFRHNRHVDIPTSIVQNYIHVFAKLLTPVLYCLC